jgi:sigma-B regulation protein RsbU (phosphoserine phosphatase)
MSVGGDNRADVVEVRPGQVPGQLDLLAELGREFATSLDIERTLVRAIQRITTAIGAAGGALFMLEEEGALLRCHACAGASEIVGLTLGSRDGIVGRVVQSNRAEIVRDVRADSDFFAGVDAKTGLTTRSILCAPLSVQDERLGAIELINKQGENCLFDAGDLSLLQTLCASAALAIMNARMAAQLVGQERLRRELELAAEIQRSLLPAEQPAPFPVCGVNRAARTVSGDFYDHFTLADGRIAFAVGDVSGKGMNAALLMAKTASLFRCLGKEIDRPGVLLGRINAEVCETATRGMFVTLVGGIFDPKTGTVLLANAGHEPPLLHKRDGTFVPYPADAPPLGIGTGLVAAEIYPEVLVPLGGGTLYIFTDGLTEGYAEDGQPLEISRVMESISAHAGDPLAERIARTSSAVVDQVDGLRDDVTLLGIEDDAARCHGSDGRTLLHRRFPARAAAFKDIRAAVRTAAEVHGVGDQDAHDLVLSIDEACQNIVRHAYGSDGEGDIVVELRCEGDALIVLLRDFADPVGADALRGMAPDAGRVGGLGVHLMRSVMNEVTLLAPPSGRGNLLRMVKRLGAGQAP